MEQVHYDSSLHTSDQTLHQRQLGVGQRQLNSNPPPPTEAVIGYAPAGTVDSASKAIAAARDAFDSGPWPLALNQHGRARRLYASHALCIGRSS